MKTIKLPVVLGAAFALMSAFAPTASHAESISEADKKVMLELRDNIRQDNLAWDIEVSLTTEVGARYPGTEGDKRAIKWAQEKMKSLGFDKVWAEEVAIEDWHRGELHAAITTPFHQPVFAIALGGSVGTPQGGIEGEVVHFADFDALKAAPKASLEGKIAFVSYRMERHKNGSGYGKAVGARVSGAAVAAEKGAIGFIMRSVGTDDNRHGHTGVMRYKDGVKKIPGIALSNPDADILEHKLALGEPVLFEMMSTSHIKKDHGKTANVIGEITGSERPDEIVLLGAHLDSWDVGTGAIDDGMGVSITMAAVAHLAKLPQRPKRTIRVVLFAAEEIGLLGVKQYMKDHEDELKQYTIGAEWDFGNGHIYQLKPGVGAAGLNGIRELAGYLAPLGVSLHPENNAQAQSDMSLLSKAGMPAINFAPDGSDYFDFHHTENDTIDKVNVDGLKQAATVYTLFAFFAAQTDADFTKSPVH